MSRHYDVAAVRSQFPDRADRSPHIYVLHLPTDAWADCLASRNDGIRVSFGLFNTTEDVDQFARILAERGALPARAGAAA
ncbi:MULTISPECIES: hypothetical protein [unclassified Bradyrhizobium]